MAAWMEKHYYASLNRVSSVDMLGGWLWGVERLVAQKQNATVGRILLLIILTLSKLICKKSCSSEMIGKRNLVYISLTAEHPEVFLRNQGHSLENESIFFRNMINFHCL